MVFTHLCIIVVVVRVLELVLESLYKLLSKSVRNRNGEQHSNSEQYSSSSYKRLSTDVTYVLHKEVVDMAAHKGMTLKEYVLGAIMARLKSDSKKKVVSVSDYQRMGA